MENLFNQLKIDLIDDKYYKLHNLNDCILNKFFEFVLKDDQYISSLKDGKSHLFFNRYNHLSKKILVIAMQVYFRIESVDIECFKTLYKDYINYRLRGDISNTQELYDVHVNAFTNLILRKDIDTLKYCYDTLNLVYYEKLKELRISSWMLVRNLSVLEKLDLNMIITVSMFKCVDVFEFLEKNKIYIRSKHLKIIRKLGCDVVRKKMIVAEYVSTIEFRFISNEDVDIDLIDIEKLLKTIESSGKNKQYIYDYFVKKDANYFFEFLSNISNKNLTFITCKRLVALIKFFKPNYEITNEMSEKLRIHLFQFHGKLTSEFLRTLKNTNLIDANLRTHEAIQFAYDHLNKKLDYSMSKDKNAISTYKTSIEVFLNTKTLIDDIDDKYENVLKIKKPNDINLLYEIFPTLQRSIKKMVFYKIIEAEDTMCSICLEDFDETNQDVNLICGHRLHTNCIDKYIKNIENLNKLKCPICRTNFHIKSLL